MKENGANGSLLGFFLINTPTRQRIYNHRHSQRLTTRGKNKQNKDNTRCNKGYVNVVSFYQNILLCCFPPSSDADADLERDGVK